jgi:hypothetical protein
MSPVKEIWVIRNRTSREVQYAPSGKFAWEREGHAKRALPTNGWYYNDKVPAGTQNPKEYYLQNVVEIVRIV